MGSEDNWPREKDVLKSETDYSSTTYFWLAQPFVLEMGSHCSRLAQHDRMVCVFYDCLGIANVCTQKIM